MSLQLWMDRFRWSPSFRAKWVEYMNRRAKARGSVDDRWEKGSMQELIPEDFQASEQESDLLQWHPVIQIGRSLFLEQVAYVWCRLEPGSFGDLALVEQGGEPPSKHWLDDDMDFILNDAWVKQDGPSGYCYPLDRADWALTREIAPGQPFLVKVLPPQWHQGPEDADCEWTADIVQRIPWTPERVTRAWARWFSHRQRYMERCEREYAAARARQEAEREHWYIELGQFGREYWLSARLATDLDPLPKWVDRRPCHMLINSQSETFKQNEAIQVLADEMKTRWPDITDDFVRSLKVQFARRY